MEQADIFCEITEKRAERRNILIVDDDVQMLKIFRYYLMDTYDVSVVNSGWLAIKLMEEYCPDAVLLDYLMPECNGAEVLQAMKKCGKTQKIPVIFLTGVTDEATIKECLSFHPVDYIVKPIAKMALINKMDTLFRHIV